ncbi:hypothetical protein [Oceanobacillus oncorhynchi]|uniref:hypothetical protein n=1 Tax=Oceanobacillus oncorhynchi TaxID=545501 RepID=UPI001867899D|nr:hypothetical protein [Oceanobacillus oncorhynchi]
MNRKRNYLRKDIFLTVYDDGRIYFSAKVMRIFRVGTDNTAKIKYNPAFNFIYFDPDFQFPAEDGYTRLKLHNQHAKAKRLNIKPGKYLLYESEDVATFQRVSEQKLKDLEKEN